MQNRSASFSWMLMRHCQHLCLTMPLTAFTLGNCWTISLQGRPKAETESTLVWQFAGSVHPCCWRTVRRGATIQVEHLWGAVSRAYRVDTLCGYLRSAFPQEASSLVLEKVCAEHSAVHGRKLGY